MYTAKVIGTVVCSHKDERLRGISLLVIQTIEFGKPARVIVAADATRLAGIGDLVTVIGSKEASIAFKASIPIDAGIVGIIDTIDEI